MIWAKISFQFEGVHRWKECPDDHPHSYIKNFHRHLFCVTVWIEQRHNHRDVEYLEFRSMLVKKFPGGNLGDNSCESIATEIKLFCEKFLNRKIKVEVLEDGENGALVE